MIGLTVFAEVEGGEAGELGDGGGEEEDAVLTQVQFHQALKEKHTLRRGRRTGKETNITARDLLHCRNAEIQILLHTFLGG